MAIFDLIEENSFGVPGRDDGPYVLKISQEESKLTFGVETANGETAATIVVSMTPFRPLLKDYFLVCETYYSAIRDLEPAPDRGDRPRAHEAAQRRRGAHGAAADRHDRHRPGDGPALVRAGFGFALAGVTAKGAPRIRCVGERRLRCRFCSPPTSTLAWRKRGRRLSPSSADAADCEREPFLDSTTN